MATSKHSCGEQGLRECVTDVLNASALSACERAGTGFRVTKKKDLSAALRVL